MRGQYILIAALLATALGGCEEVAVQGGLEERSANEIAMLLDANGIPSRKHAEAAASGTARTYAVDVSASDAGRAFRLLAAHALPRVSPPGFDEVLRSQSLIPTSAEERARHTQALSGEITRTFESIRGVLEARVHLAIPEPQALEVDDALAPTATASVLLKVAGDAPTLSIEDARRLVAGAVQGLSPQAVTVVVVQQPPPAPAASDGLVSVAGVRVSPGSVGTLRLMLGGALGLDVLLAGALVLGALRYRAFRASKEPAS